MAFTSMNTMNGEENVALTFETEKGKVIEVYMEPRGVCMYKIRFKSGGQLPKEFKSNFTSKQRASNAVKAYLARMASEKGKSKVEAKEEDK